MSDSTFTRQTTRPLPANFPKVGLGTAAFYGFGAGLLGVAAMTLANKLEQSLTTRPSSYVPGHTLLRLLGHSFTSIKTLPASTQWNYNMLMHYGQGAVLGMVRGVMSWYGVRGPVADFMFMVLRLVNDQTLENVTGVGALPWTWPVGEQWVDLGGKAVFAFVTGWVVDLWVE